MDIVKRQLVYWARINADGTIADQNGIGLLTVGLAASVYTITMPANFTVPVNRRGIHLTPIAIAGAARQVTYDQAASANNTVIVRGWDLAVPAAADAAFLLEINRIMDEIGAGVG